MHKTFISENLIGGWMLLDDELTDSLKPEKQSKSSGQDTKDTSLTEDPTQGNTIVEWWGLGCNKQAKGVSGKNSATASFVSGTGSEEAGEQMMTMKLLLLGASQRAKAIFWEGCISDYTHLDPTFLDSRFVTENMIFKDFFLEMSYVADLEPPLDGGEGETESGLISPARRPGVLKKNNSVFKNESFRSCQSPGEVDPVSDCLKYASEVRRADAAVITFDWSDSQTIEAAYRWAKWMNAEFPIVRLFMLGIRQDEMFQPSKEKIEQLVSDIKTEFEVYLCLDFGAGYYKTLRKDVQAVINSLAAEVRVVKDTKLNQALKMSFRVL